MRFGFATLVDGVPLLFFLRPLSSQLKKEVSFLRCSFMRRIDVWIINIGHGLISTSDRRLVISGSWNRALSIRLKLSASNTFITEGVSWYATFLIELNITIRLGTSRVIASIIDAQVRVNSVQAWVSDRGLFLGHSILPRFVIFELFLTRNFNIIFIIFVSLSAFAQWFSQHFSLNGRFDMLKLKLLFDGDLGPIHFSNVLTIVINLLLFLFFIIFVLLHLFLPL